MIRILLACIFLLPAASSSAQVARQKLIAMVRQDCGSCHGLTLKGGLGAALLPKDLAGKDEDALASIIEDGVPGTPMPPWRGLVSVEDAHWIAKKLKEGFPE